MSDLLRAWRLPEQRKPETFVLQQQDDGVLFAAMESPSGLLQAGVPAGDGAVAPPLSPGPTFVSLGDRWRSRSGWGLRRPRRRGAKGRRPSSGRAGVGAGHRARQGPGWPPSKAGPGRPLDCKASGRPPDFKAPLRSPQPFRDGPPPPPFVVLEFTPPSPTASPKSPGPRWSSGSRRPRCSAAWGSRCGGRSTRSVC